MQRCRGAETLSHLSRHKLKKHVIDIITALNARIVQFALQRAEVLA